MITQPVAVRATRCSSSPTARRLIKLLPLGFLFILRFQHISAQTLVSGTQIRNPLTPVAALPSTCTPYSVYYLTTTNTAYICAATNTFTPLAAGTGGGSELPSQNGTPGYLFTNGTTVSWGNILTGGSGALDCVSTTGRCDVTSIVPLKNATNIWTGANDFHSGLLRIPESTISALPPAFSNIGREFMVTDGASTCDTTTGGGSARVLVQSTGAVYVAPNCSTGTGESSGASSTSQLTDFAPALANGTMTIQPGRIRFGTMPCTNFTSPATAAISSMSGGTGVGKLYVSSACALVMQYPNSLTVTWGIITGMSAQPVVTPTVPSDAWYLGEVNIGPSAITAVTDKRSIPGMDATKAGTGIIEDCTLGPCLISTDPAVIPTLGGVNTYTGAQDNTTATITKPSRTVSSDPSGSCSQNNEIVLSTSSGNSFSCLSGTWHAMGGGATVNNVLTGTPVNHGVAIGSTGQSNNYTAAGIAGYVLTSNGPSGDPTFQASTGGGGGGGGSQYVATASPQVMTDSGDTIIAATSNLPPLPAGACWDYKIIFTAVQNANPTAIKVWFGPGQTVGIDYTAGSPLMSDLPLGTTEQSVYKADGQICNNNGTQTAQTATIFLSLHGIAGFTYAATGPMTQAASASNLQIGISWAAADFIKVQSFQVWRTQ